MTVLRRFALWLLLNIPLGCLAPKVLAFALKIKGEKQ